MQNRSKYHWIIIAICCSLAASAIGICNNSVGVFFTSASTELGVGRGAFALHATLSNLIAGLFCPISIKLIKKYNYRMVISAGIILASGSIMLMSLGNSVWMFYILGALRGIGCSMFALPTISYIVGNWFEEKHGFAMGLTLAFSGLSGAVFSPMFSYFILAMGWRYSYLIMGLSVIILALPGTMFVLKLKPDEKNLLPYGAEENKAKEAETAVENKDAVKNKKIPKMPLIFMILFAFLSASVCGIAQHFPGYTESIGATATLGATMISAAMIGNIIFKLLIGVLSDKIGPFNASRILIFANVLSLTVLFIVNPGEYYVVTLATAFMYGAIYAVGAVGVPVVTRNIFGAEKSGSVYSFIFMFTSIGSAGSLTIVGLLYDAFGTYKIGILAGVVIGMINIVIVSVLKKIKNQQVNDINQQEEMCAN